MHLIDADTVHRLLDYPSLIDALAKAHRQPPPLVDRLLLRPDADSPYANESFLVLPAWAPGRALGVKMATVQPGNAERGNGLPMVQAVYQLFDGATGRPLAVIDGTALTLRKTAADSGLGCRLLARADVRTLLMIGAGALAPHLIAAHRAARPSLQRVRVWNRTAAAGDALIAALRADGIDAAPAPDLDAAVAEADVICAATAAYAPLIRGGHVRPGTHIDLVGAFSPEMRESDDATVRRATLFVDLRLTTVEVAGDLAQPIAAGVIGVDDIRADLFELCTGRHPGRTTPDEITLFKNGGGGHLDLFTAEYLIARATAHSIA